MTFNRWWCHGSIYLMDWWLFLLLTSAMLTNDGSGEPQPNHVAFPAQLFHATLKTALADVASYFLYPNRFQFLMFMLLVGSWTKTKHEEIDLNGYRVVSISKQQTFSNCGYLERDTSTSKFSHIVTNLLHQSQTFRRRGGTKRVARGISR